MDYEPPGECGDGTTWQAIVLNITATSNGTQYDRLSVRFFRALQITADALKDPLPLTHRDLTHLDCRANTRRHHMDGVSISPCLTTRYDGAQTQRRHSIRSTLRTTGSASARSRQPLAARAQPDWRVRQCAEVMLSTGSADIVQSSSRSASSAVELAARLQFRFRLCLRCLSSRQIISRQVALWSCSYPRSMLLSVNISD